MFLILFFLPLCLGVLLPRPNGPFQVALTNSQLIDQTRLDPWKLDAIKNRRLMISRFDPISPKSCYRKQKLQYMTPVVAAAEDEILGPYGWPSGVLGIIEMAVCSPHKHHLSWKAPIILFSPGLNTTRFYYSALALEVASRGYSVITIDHPFETDIVEFPDGNIAYGGNVNTSDLASINFALDIRATDVSFVLDTLGLNNRKKDKVVMFGDSFGGAAVGTAMMNDTRIRGGVNLDGLMFGPVINSGFPDHDVKQSFMLWGSEGHNATEDPDWSKFWSVLEEQGIWKRELSLKGSAHGSFWDMPLIADVSGIRGNLSEDTQEWLIGKLPGARVVEVLGEYLDDYFQFVLRKGAGEGLLSGPSPRFPDVLFL